MADRVAQLRELMQQVLQRTEKTHAVVVGDGTDDNPGLASRARENLHRLDDLSEKVDDLEDRIREIEGVRRPTSLSVDQSVQPLP